MSLWIFVKFIVGFPIINQTIINDSPINKRFI